MEEARFIDRICIENFKGFANETFNFLSRFTVVIGDNGSGKTALLDALAVAAGTYFIGIEGVPARVIGNDEVRREEVSRSQVELQFPVVIEAFRHEGEREQRWKREKRSLRGKTLYAAARYLSELATEQQQLVRANEVAVTLPVIAYHGTGRLWAEHNETGVRKPQKIDWMARGPRTDGYRLALSTKSSSKIFLSWYKTLDYEFSRVESPEDAVQLAAFSEALRNMVSEWKEIYFSPREEDLIGYLNNSAGENKWLPFRMLSDGYRNMISLVADIAFRCIKLNPHLGLEAVKQTPGLVLIDEIDLHLHPKWQKQVVADLKRTFPLVQFVVTTHSPFIVQSLKSEELINLNGDESTATTDPFRQSIEEVAAQEMIVPDVERSDLFKQMQATAKEYFELIRKGVDLDSKNLIGLKHRLNELESRYSDDPAFVALLRAEKHFSNAPGE